MAFCFARFKTDILVFASEGKSSLVASDVFLDYTQTSLVEELNTFDKICAYEKTLGQIDEASAEILYRAKKVALGNISFNQLNEFSTNPSSQNVIQRYGDIASYCRNDLLMSSFGTNRQVTGICAYAGQEINIFVVADENDPLPKIRFSQQMGSWRKWLGGEVQLKKGKNTFIVPNFYHSDYVTDVVLGGAIYISNPYTSTQQSENVKVYIEGGTRFPVLRANVDENLFKAELENYANKVKENPNKMIDIVEIVGDHVIVSAQATKASEIYKNYSPLLAIEKWNEYMDKLLEFGGVTQDATNPLFDERNLHINCNIRITQPWSGGWMFAYTEHIGIRADSQTSSLYGSGFGWGVSHELGHAFDNRLRVIGETTNNMFAKYNETAIEQANTRGEFSRTLNTLSNDLTYSSSPYFVTTKYNYLIWWYIETWQKGFWGNLDNCYRGIYPKLNQFLEETNLSVSQLTKTELQVFYSSIVTGVDMSYYFERWGYSIGNNENDPVFKISTASQAFCELIAKAVETGYIDNTKEYKLWYQNYLAYHNTNTTPIYSNSYSPSIMSVTKTSNGYNIFINHTENENHLGYEILEGNDVDGYDVIGFSYTSTWTDLTEYSLGYTPTYKVVAVDNTFNMSNMSDAKTISSYDEFVCKIGEKSFTSLMDAIGEASEDDIIELLKSFESSCLTINKNLTIKLATSVSTDIVIKKIESGHLFSVANGVTLTINGNGQYRLVLDGNNFLQSGSLLNVFGVINADNLTLKNNISSNNGGAIVFQNNSKNSLITNCQFENNKANNGIIACEHASISASISNSKFFNNVVTNDGIIFNKGTLTLDNVEVKNNTSKQGTIKNYAGGVMNINSCVITNNQAEFCAGLQIDGKTEIFGGEIGNNLASEVRGLYFSGGNSKRTLKLNGVKLYDSDIVIEKSSATFIDCEVANSNIKLSGGNLCIVNDCDICADFEIVNGANLVLKNGTFLNFSNCNFTLIDFENNMSILKAENFTLSEDDKEAVRLTNSALSVDIVEDKLVARGGVVVLTYKINGATETHNHNCGDSVVLKFLLNDREYVSSIIDELGNKYSWGETIIATTNMTLTFTIGSKVKINFDYGDRAEFGYFVPYSNLTLPTSMENGLKLHAWKDGGNVHFVDDEFVVTGTTTLTAMYEKLYNLKVLNGDEIIYDEYYVYGDKVDLSKLGIAQPDFWTENDSRIGDVVLMDRDAIINANFLPKSKDAENENNKSMIPILTIILVLIIVIALLVIWMYYRRKNKIKKHIG